MPPPPPSRLPHFKRGGHLPPHFKNCSAGPALRYLFATLLVMCKMIVRWRDSLSALLLLKWITKSYWDFSELSECKHIYHCDRFIFYISLWVFHNSNKSKLLTLIKKKFICSTVLHTVFVLFASQLTAALPFSMSTSSQQSILESSPETRFMFDIEKLL